MVLAPETAVSPLATAPPDRATSQLEDVCRQLLALVLGDRVIDQNERRILYETFATLGQAAQAGGPGSLGSGPPGGAGPDQGLAPSPMDMNMNTEDMGTAEGATPEDTGGGY